MYQARCIYLAYSMMVSIDSAQNMFKTLDRDTKKCRIAKEGVAANTVDVYNCRYNKNTTLIRVLSILYIWKKYWIPKKYVN